MPAVAPWVANLGWAYFPGASYAGALAIGSTILAVTAYNIRKANDLKDNNFGKSPGQQLIVRSTTAARNIVYGQAEVGGVITYQNTRGIDNQTMDMEVIHTGHEIEGFVAWRFDNREVPIADVDDINASPAGNGAVNADTNSHAFGPPHSTSVMFLRGWLGTATQGEDNALSGNYSEITTTHRHRSCARSVLRFDLAFGTEQVWDGGMPRAITAVIKGKKVYDPRLDSTFTGDWGTGSGSHRVATPGTWEWSDNPALIWADYRIDAVLGPGWDSGRIDYNSVAEAADLCDELVDIPPAGSPATQEKRFTCNCVLDTGMTPRESIEVILASMAGNERQFGGTWHVYASAYEATSFTLDEDDFIGAVEFRKQPLTADRYNTVRGYYFDPDREYKQSPFLQVQDSTLLSTRDSSRELFAELKLHATNSEYMAQRLAYRHLNQADNTGLLVALLNYKAADMRVGNTVSITLDEIGWAAKVFRVMQIRFVPTQGFEVTLKEDSSAAYADPAVGDYATRTAAGVVVFPAIRRPEPGAGVAGDSVVSDPWFIRRAAIGDDYTVYDPAYCWTFTQLTPGAGEHTADIIDTGGVVGGVLQVSLDASAAASSVLFGVPNGEPMFFEGEQFRLNLKIRRVSGSPTAGTMAIGTSSLNADKVTGVAQTFASISAATVAAWTANEWQFLEYTNAPNVSGQTSIYVVPRANFDSNFDADTELEIDMFNLTRVS